MISFILARRNQPFHVAVSRRKQKSARKAEGRKGTLGGSLARETPKATAKGGPKNYPLPYHGMSTPPHETGYLPVPTPKTDVFFNERFMEPARYEEGCYETIILFSV